MVRGRVFTVFSIIANFLTAAINAQFGAVGTPCYSSGTCFGYTMCQQNRCVCTSGYQQMGQTCVQMTMQSGYGPYGMGAMGVGGVGMSMIYPGQPCGAAYGACGYGSFCQSGVCCCPTGFTQTVTGCVSGVGMSMGVGSLGYGMGYGMGYGASSLGYGMGGLGYGMSGLGYGMSSLGYGMSGLGYGVGGYGIGLGYGMSSASMMPMYSGVGGMGCMGGCGGGAFCQSGMCVCSQSMIYQNGMCMPMGGYASMGVGSQIVLSINVGGYCQSQSVMSHCVMGATCVQSTCRCMGDFFAQGTYCVRRRLRKEQKQNSNEPNNDESTKPEENQASPKPPIQVINSTSTPSSLLNWLPKQQ